MELLRVRHQDFTLTFECEDWQKRWEKGKKLLGGAHHLTSTYTCSGFEAGEDRQGYRAPSSAVAATETVAYPDATLGGVAHYPVIEHLDDSGRHTDVITQGADNQNAFFFEQTDYSIWCEFSDKIDVEKAGAETNLKEVNSRFSYKKHRQVLMGFLNYGNEIGRADFKFYYTLKGGETKHFVFSYDVLSAKLDYHHDWKIILRDIEEEYRMLSLDYLRKTYHGISEGEGDSFDLIWWNIFHGLQDEFIRACKNIIDRPRHRLRAVSSYKRADQIRRFNSTLEQQFAEHKAETEYKYFTQEQQTTHNTIENRFLKHTLQMIEKRYSALAKRILQELVLKISPEETERIRQTANELNHLVRNPFFRTVGKFEGLRQESLILQRDVNYSKIYRTSAILQKSFNLNDGMYRMETKDIATLYEIWCFIQVEKVVRELFGETIGEGIEIDHQNRTEMNGSFVRELGKGEHSRIVFRHQDVTLAELVYNPRHDDHEDDIRGIGDLRSYTVPQKPDIVLQLTKDDLQRGMNMTYLFDAKYRIESDKSGRDVPPQDAINQMHRYRDAIYYSTPHNGLKKEVLGGYILFPGKMTEADHFRQTIDEVNIGAFPMRPGDEAHQMLRDFIADLMRQNAIEIVEQVIPQKALYYTTEPEKSVQPKNILTGSVRREDSYLQAYLNHTAKEYIIESLPTKLLNAKYLLPMVLGKIDGYYRIEGIKQSNENKRLLLKLGEYISIGQDWVHIYAHHMLPNELIKKTEMLALYNDAGNS